MTVLDAARLHLAKAKQFYEAAERNSQHDLYDAATSNAVISGINSKDAICLATTGTSNKSEHHMSAVNELKSASPDAAKVAAAFQRLLSIKSKAQYHQHATTKPKAEAAISQAQRMVDVAERIVRP